MGSVCMFGEGRVVAPRWWIFQEGTVPPGEEAIYLLSAPPAGPLCSPPQDCQTRPPHRVPPSPFFPEGHDISWGLHWTFFLKSFFPLMPNSVIHVNYRYLGSIECCCEGNHMQPYFQKKTTIYITILYILLEVIYFLLKGGGVVACGQIILLGTHALNCSEPPNTNLLFICLYQRV